MKYCPYCGAGLDADMRFCPKCGKPFEESKENPHITGKHVKKEPADYAESTCSFPINDEPKKKKHGGIIALVIAVVLIALSAGLYFGAVFKPKEEPVVPFSDNTAAIAEASNSVVMLSCYDKDGEMCTTASGFVVFDDSIIVTNYHVIEQDTYRVTAQTEKGDSFDCPTVLAWDADKDIAILKAERHTGLSLLTPGSTENLQKGEKVVAIGSPLGLINSVSTGVFSGFVTDDAGTTLQFTAAVSHGSSGGALFNDAGEVIGVTFATLQDGQNINLAVPIEDVKILYESGAANKQQQLKDFYESFEHESPISSYTVGYVLEHYKELDGETMYIEGYVSSMRMNSFYIVDSADMVLGYDVGSVLAMVETEGARIKDYSCIHIAFPNQDEEITALGIKPGDMVSIMCQLSIRDKNEEGKILEGGRRLTFTPFEITQITNYSNSLVSGSSAPTYTVGYVLEHYEELEGQKISVDGFLSLFNLLFETAEQVKDDYLAEYRENHDNASFVAGMQQNIADNKAGLNLHGTGNVDLSSYTIGDCIRVTGFCHVNMTVYGELGYVSMDVESVDLISHRG